MKMTREKASVFRHGYTVAFLAMLLVSTWAGPAHAQDVATQPTPEELLGSPRGTVKTFLIAIQKKDFIRATECLDLSDISEDRRGQRGPELAKLLQELIDDRLPTVKIEVLSDDPDYKDIEDPARAQVYVLTRSAEDQSEITIARGSDGLWRFSRQTVALLPKLIEPLTTQPAATQPAAETGVPAKFRSARATMMTFMSAMNALAKEPDRIEEAVACLDLSGIESVLQDRGPTLAKMLKDVIDRTAEVIEKSISDDPAGEPYVFREDKVGSIVIARKEPEGKWLFSAETVAGLHELSQVVRATEERKVEPTEADADISSEFWLQDQMPKSLTDHWLDLQIWQWLAIGVLIVVGVVVDALVRSVLNAVIGSQLRRRHVKVDSKVQASVLRPIGLFVMGFLWWKYLGFLLLPPAVDAILLPAAKIITGVAAVWAVYRLIDLLGAYLAVLAARTESRYDDLLVPLIRRVLKIAVTVVGFVFLADIFEWPLGNVLAGLGIGGLAIGFAAREVLQNFFGSITVLIDRPFQIGDWVKVGDSEGSVESVGFRSTRIRTFYNSLITVPNGTLLTATVDNLGARRYRRIKTMLSLTYDTTPEKIDAFCEGIRELIRRHPYTRKDYYHVYFNEYADSSLNVLLYCFLETPDWPTELRERHRLFSDILKLAQWIGVSFAFPTQTIHLHKEQPTEADTGTAPGSESPLTKTGQALGRHVARQLVTESGLDNTIPPPVSFNPKDRGESNDED